MPYVKIKKITWSDEPEKMIDISVQDNHNFILANGICVCNSAMLDINMLRLADTLLFKEPSLLQSRFERKAITDLFKKADLIFRKIRDGNKKKYVYVVDDEFEGMISFTLPDFWTEDLSKNYSKALDDNFK